LAFAFYGGQPAATQSGPTIESITGGKVKPGMEITADNLDLIYTGNPETDLIFEETAERVKKGMVIEIARRRPLETPSWFKAATEQNKGRAVIGDDGNLTTVDGGLWCCGIPFPDVDPNDPQGGLKIMYNKALTYEGDDFIIKNWEIQYIGSDGKIEKTIQGTWDRLYTTSREYVDPKPHMPGQEKFQFKQLFMMIRPFDLRGFANIQYRYYDQNKIDDSYAYIPALRRTRRLSAGQRYDSFVGTDWTLGDSRQFDDPILHWDYKILRKKPMLGVMHADYPVYGIGTKDAVYVPLDAGKFARGKWELRPDVYILELVPKDKNHVYSKKHLSMDAESWQSLYSQAFDRQGKLWRTVQNYWYGFIRSEDGTSNTPFVWDYDQGKPTDVFSETIYYVYDHQIDHVTNIQVNLAGQSKNLGLKPNHFSLAYLDRIGKTY
jgi:hypothetical protein